jgi:hypothetical protein
MRDVNIPWNSPQPKATAHSRSHGAALIAGRALAVLLIRTQIFKRVLLSSTHTMEAGAVTK